MNREILERRLQMLDYSFSGLRCSEWVPIIAREFNVSESAVWSDWGRRETWLPKILMLDRGAFKLNELFIRLERAMSRAFSLMLVSTDENVRIRATRTVGALSKAMFDIGSQTGMYPSLLRDVLAKLEELEALTK